MGADVANPDFASFLQTRAAERDLVEDRHESLGAGKRRLKDSETLPFPSGSEDCRYNDRRMQRRASSGANL